MAKLSAFNNISLDGYFSGKNGEFAWAKSHMDPELTRSSRATRNWAAPLCWGALPMT